MLNILYNALSGRYIKIFTLIDTWFKAGERMSFLKNVSWMGTGTIISICISALSVPILLKAFTITEVSYFLWLWTLIGIMNLADMGASRGVSKYISGAHEKFKILKYAFFYVLIIFSIVIMISFVLLFFTKYEPWTILPNFIKISSLLIVFFGFLSFPLAGYVEGSGGFQYISIVKNLCTIFSYSLPIIYLKLGFDIEYIVYFSVVLSRVLLFLLLSFFTFLHVKIIDKSQSEVKFKNFYSFCLSVGVASSLGIIFLYWDRFLAVTVLSHNLSVYYIAFSELVIKGYAIPGIIVGVIFQYFSSGKYQKNHVKLVTLMRPRFAISFSFGISVIAVLGYYLLHNELNKLLFHNINVADLTTAMYIIVFFSVLNCFSMIFTTIGQALDNHKKILCYQVIMLPFFTLFSYLIAIQGHFTLSLVIWFLRIPVVLYLTLSVNYFKIAHKDII